MKYLIIGASAAAISAAETLRNMDVGCDIIIVSKDDHVHSRCMLHKVIDGERTVEGIDFSGTKFFDRNMVKWVKGKAVVSVHPETKKITLENEAVMSYDRLLIATGAVSFVPPVNNLRECEQVYCLRDIEDALAIREAVSGGAKNVVVMGAGLVGMDAVYGLLHKDVNIHVVEMADRILPLQLDEYAAGFYRKKFEDSGVVFHLAKKLANVALDGGKLRAVELDGGETIPCDIIIVASGVRANTAFLEGSGIKTDRGVVVDDYMRTSHRAIYAAGDVTGLSGTWGAAVKQGQVAARNMMRDGTSVYMDRYNMKNTMNFFDAPALSIGVVVPPDDSYDVSMRVKGDLYQKLVMKDGFVEGALFLGDIANKGHWQHIIKNRVSLAGVGKPSLDVSYADFYDIDSDGQFWYAV